jgi:1-acyl-sn-glycerol-3-phosphate acyltransferase
VYVDRERTEGVDPLQPLVDALNKGDSVILFPEGTRGSEELPQRFKSGLYNLALRFPQVVLVPAWINNIQRVMPKGEVVPVPILCSVTFGKPMHVQHNGDVVEGHAEFGERARNAVIALREV